MRRLWLFILIGLIALQGSWAVAHGYSHAEDDHDATVTQVVAAADKQVPQEPASLEDHGCCGFAQSCHGSPVLVPCTELSVNDPEADRLASYLKRLHPHWAATRHERPQWAPA